MRSYWKVSKYSSLKFIHPSVCLLSVQPSPRSNNIWLETWQLTRIFKSHQRLMTATKSRSWGLARCRQIFFTTDRGQIVLDIVLIPAVTLYNLPIKLGSRGHRVSHNKMLCKRINSSANLMSFRVTLINSWRIDQLVRTIKIPPQLLRKDTKTERESTQIRCWNSLFVGFRSYKSGSRLWEAGAQDTERKLFAIR